MTTSIVIPVFNQWGFTNLCLHCIEKFTPERVEVIVVDDNSTDETADKLKDMAQITYYRNDSNLGFSKSVNTGIEAANGENILLLNNDTVPSYNWLSNMLKVLYADESIGLVGPVANYVLNHQVLFPIEASECSSIHKFCQQFNISDYRKWRIVDALSGFCLLFKKTLVTEIGLFDEDMGHGYCEDLDYSIRVRMAGYHCALAGDTYVHHWGSQTFSKETGERDQHYLTKLNTKKLKQKWPDILST